MRNFSASLTNPTVLPQSRDCSHLVSEAVSTPQPIHLPLLHRVNGTDHLASRRLLAACYSYSGYRCVILNTKGPQEYWHPHRSDYKNALIYAHTTPLTLPTRDMSFGSLTVGMRGMSGMRNMSDGSRTRRAALLFLCGSVFCNRPAASGRLQKVIYPV